MTLNLPKLTAGLHRWHVNAQGTDMTYALHDGASALLRIFIRGQNADDLFAAAFQQDLVGVFNADAFFAAFPGRVTPARFDRVIVPDGRRFTVEENHGAVIVDPVVFKVLLRGGQQ